jgi:hypothetical protein
MLGITNSTVHVALFGLEEVVRLLVAKGADVNMQ